MKALLGEGGTAAISPDAAAAGRAIEAPTGGTGGRVPRHHLDFGAKPSPWSLCSLPSPSLTSYW
jgi:hypothetical protein